MPFGTISRLVIDRGFGFILEDGHDEEIEFHWSAVLGGSLEQLRRGQRVQYERRPNHRDQGRFRAVDVRAIDKSE